MARGRVETAIDATALAKRNMEIKACHLVLFWRKFTNKFKKNTPF
jgi:hypothetical protein